MPFHCFIVIIIMMMMMQRTNHGWFHQSVSSLLGFKGPFDVHRIHHLVTPLHVCHALRTKVPMMLHY